MRQHIFGGVCDEELWKYRGASLSLFFEFRASLRMASSLSLSFFIVRTYEVEEDGGSQQFWSIWQKVQVNRKVNMVLPSRMFQ